MPAQRDTLPGMRALDVLSQGEVHPDVGHACDVALQERAPRYADRLTLRGYRLAGEVLSLGRYHLAPDGDRGGRVRLHRRLGGGRVLALGPEFAVVSLVMPHRSALVGDDPLALQPAQVLNRCVRGVLGGLRALGVEAFYPGRDRLTMARRTVGMVSLDVAASQATVFEAILAVENGWASHADRLSAADPTGVTATALLPADEVATLAEAVPAVPSLDELVHVIASAFAAQFGLSPQPAEAVPIPADAGARAAAWVGWRRPRPDLDRHGVAWTQLGVVDVYLRMHADAVDEVLLAGDFIADAPGIELLQDRLRGCPATEAALRRRFEDVYGDPRHFLLGVGSGELLVDAILRAAGARP